MKIVLYICIGIIVCLGLLKLIDKNEPVYDGDLTRSESFFHIGGKKAYDPENQLRRANAFLCEFKNGVTLPETASEVFFNNSIVDLTHHEFKKSANPLNVLGATTNKMETMIMAEMSIEDYTELVFKLDLEQAEDLFSFWPDAFDIKKFKSKKRAVPDLREDIDSADSNTYYGESPDLEIEIAAHHKNGIAYIAGYTESFSNLAKGEHYIKKR